MTREGLADRLVNYADAIAAFSVVNGIAFLVSLSETEIRCSMAHLRWLVVGGQICFSLFIAAGVIVLRRLEANVRSSSTPLPPDVEAYLRGFFFARLAVIAVSTAFMIGLGWMALTDPSCLSVEAS